MWTKPNFLKFSYSAVFLFIIIFFCCTPENHKDVFESSDKFKHIRYLIELGDSLRGSNPDSCKTVYKLAINLAQSIKTNEHVKHLEGLGYIGLAALNCNLGNYPESAENVRLAKLYSKQFNDTDLEAQAINIEGLLHFNQSRFDSALVFYENSLILAQKVNNLKLQGKIFTNVAIVKFYQGLCDEALADFSQTLAIAEKLNDIDLLTGTYINMGLVANHFGQNKGAIGYYEKAIENYKKINGTDGLILCYQNLSSLYFSQGNYSRAIENIQLSLKLAESIGDKSNIAKAYHNLAEIYARVGDHEQAMESYLFSISRKEELSDKAGIVDGYNGLGALFYQTERFEKSREYFEKALQISSELNLVKAKLTAFSSIAGVYVAENHYREAIIYYEKALDLAIQTGNVSSTADQQINLGSTYAKLSQFQKADSLLIKALSSKTQLNEKGGMANVYAELAQSAYRQFKSTMAVGKEKQIKNAEKFGLKAFQIASEIQELPLINSISLLLKQIYSSSENAKDALRFADLYISTKDSINLKSKAKEVTYAEARWNVEKQQSRIRNLEYEKEIQNNLIEQKNLQSKQYLLITIFAVVVLVLLSGFTLFLVFFYRRRQAAIYQQQLHDLALLKMQNISSRISPHFVFNMLSSILNAANEPEKLKERIKNVSFLLRNVIENVEFTSVTFNNEIKVVEAFTKLFEDKIPSPFYFNLNIHSDFDTEVLIPAMIIQIPVENAIKHGLMPLEEGPAELEIFAQKIAEGSQITITDNGEGLSNHTNRNHGTGSGLKIVMQTIHFLNLKNENKIRFNISDRKEKNEANSGTIVEIFIPSNYSYTN